jgi:tRNA dimethylallyltransferase
MAPAPGRRGPSRDAPATVRAAPATVRAAPAPIAAIIGPTASGKSELAMAIAARLPVEILVADSRQVYRGLSIGTAKPSASDQAAVTHHLIDLADPDEPFTVADWLTRARPIVDDVAARGRLPLVVGGTGLYLSALLDGYDLASQPWSPELRGWLAAELETEGLAVLAARLERLDPRTAARTDLRNPRRVLRALERVEAGGGPQEARSTPYPGRLALLGISRPRAELYRRIDARAAALFEAGLVDEVRGLLAAGHRSDSAALSSHGYAEAVRHLAGELTLSEAIEITARRTRQYAKRQLTWFRRDPRIVWLATGERAAWDPAIVAQAAELLTRMLA